MNVNDEIDELKKIIQEAWCEGDNFGDMDTFGAFLNRAAKAIREAGYCKVEGKPPILSDEEITKAFDKARLSNFATPFQERRVIAEAQRDADYEIFEKGGIDGSK